MTAEREALAELVAALGPLQMQIPTPIMLRVRAALAAPAQKTVLPAYRGYAALGTGQYAINHSRAGEPPELVITLATEDEKRDRQIGEPRDNPPDAPPIKADEMIIRIAFTSERGLFALEDQLAWVRRVHFTPAPIAAPAQGEPQPVNRALFIATDGRETPLPEVWVVWGKDGVDLVAPLEYMAQEHANLQAESFPDQGPWRVHRYVLPAQEPPVAQDYDALVVRLRGYNPPDRTIDEQRQMSQDICDAADVIAALRAENERQAREIARWDELHRVIAEELDCDVETWPDHRNAPLAIAAKFVLIKQRAERAEAECEKLRADAERYRFWRKFYDCRFALKLGTITDSLRAAGYAQNIKLSFSPTRPQVEIAKDYESLVDVAIDAAREGK